MKARMAHAGIESALAVETRKGDNPPWLQQMMAEPSPQFRLVLCFRPDRRSGTAACFRYLDTSRWQFSLKLYY